MILRQRAVRDGYMGCRGRPLATVGLLILFFKLALLCVVPAVAAADLFHANNFLVGDRAVGLGGAFCAIADDASAIAYNPAGMAFAQSSKFIGSGTAFYNRITVYRDIVGSDDFTESSSGSVPSFFGLLQQIPRYGVGTAIGIAFYAPDGESRSQNDLIRREDLGIRSFHRTINSQSSTNYFGVGAATLVSGSLALGLAGNVVRIRELTQEFQTVTRKVTTTGLVLTEEAAQRGVLYSDLSQNRKFQLDVMAIEPMIGLQWTPVPTLAVGFAVRKPFIISQKFRQDWDLAESKRFADFTPFSASDIKDGSEEQWLKLRQDGVKVTRQNPSEASDGRQVGVIKISEPLGGLPAEFRLGLAWFASTRFLVAGDVSYRLAPSDGEMTITSTADTLNFHLGLEAYLNPSFPVRLGLFTNNDLRPKLERGGQNQEEHIDYYGGSVVLGWAAGNVQLGIGSVVQLGRGEAQKISGERRVQKVDSLFYSAILSAATAM